jgi:hypothetical protein
MQTRTRSHPHSPASKMPGEVLRKPHTDRLWSGHLPTEKSGTQPANQPQCPTFKYVMHRWGTFVRAKYAADTRCLPELLPPSSPLLLLLLVKFCSWSSHRTSSRTRHMRASRLLHRDKCTHTQEQCVCRCVRACHACRCMQVHAHVRACVCVCVCAHACHACRCMQVHAHVRACVCVCVHVMRAGACRCMHTCEHVCVHVCVGVCVSIFNKAEGLM